MISQIFKNRIQILEGIKNNLFKREHIEIIAAERLQICIACNQYDETGIGCAVIGTQPCCNKDGGCGCSLAIKTRSLASACPLVVPKWEAVLTVPEAIELNKTI